MSGPTHYFENGKQAFQPEEGATGAVTIYDAMGKPMFTKESPAFVTDELLLAKTQEIRTRMDETFSVEDLQVLAKLEEMRLRMNETFSVEDLQALAQLQALVATINDGIAVTTLPALSAGTQVIGNVGINNKSTHENYDINVGATAVVIDMTARGGVNHIQYINNSQGTMDLFITFDDMAVTGSIVSGANRQIRLRPGETLNNLPRKALKINFIRPTGAALEPVRFVGV